jgi:hypothetical protein
MEPCPVWTPGQLYIGGIGLAHGYWRDEEKTRVRFISHPGTGERLYCTGDLGRYLPDGNIEFLGREDFQVKIQGYRIELGEIEAALTQCPGVRAVVVTLSGGSQTNKRLVAYVVPDQQPSPAGSELREFLKRKLPEYMLPSNFVMLESLPLTRNGKVNRQALPAPGAYAAEAKTGYVAPRTMCEKALAQIWTEVLGVERVGIYDNFFDMGGDSLMATQLVTRARASMAVELSFREFFTSPTIEGLALCAEEAILAKTSSVKVDAMLDWLEGVEENEARNMLLH